MTERGEVLDLKYEEVSSNKFINEYNYGIFIKKESNVDKNNKIKNRIDSNNRYIILNAGILVQQAYISELFNNRFRDDIINRRGTRKFYLNIYINFPSNWLQVDVSREKVTGFTEMVMQKNLKDGCNVLGENIAKSLHAQINDFLKYVKKERIEVPLIYLQEIIQYAINFSMGSKYSNVHVKLRSIQYYLIIEFIGNGIVYKMEPRGREIDSIKIKYANEEARKSHIFWQKKVCSKEVKSRSVEVTLDDERFNVRYKDIRRLGEDIIYKDSGYALKSIMKELGLGKEYGKVGFLGILTVLLLEIPYENFTNNKFFENRNGKSLLLLSIEDTVLQNLTVNNASEGIIVNYEDIEKII